MVQARHLDPQTAAPDPITQLRRWYDEAVAAGARQPDAMTLATATPEGVPSARTVLLRGFDDAGLRFYTNLESPKATVLARNPVAALVLHWREVERQVRVTGPVARVPDDEASRYWSARPRGHRISAWASPQSEPITFDELAARVAVVERRFAGIDPPLPEFWGGYVVAPVEVEFWQGRADRLHDRVRYRRGTGNGWMVDRLAP